MDDEPNQVLAKKENTSEEDNHRTEELIMPDGSVISPNEDFDMEKAIKTEPLETPTFMDEYNPCQCFECGLDCESQGELIDHYDTAHSKESSRKSDYNGNSCSEEVDGTKDPLAGDVAPDTSEKAANVEGAQNDATPRQVLLLYTCPCCGHSSTDWNQLVKHIEEHVQVTCLSCSNCVHIFSSSYSLKDYTGADPVDEPHVCCHCPFKTRWYQNLKDHCVTHHKNTALMNGSNHHSQNYILSNSVSQSALIPAFDMATFQRQNSVRQMAFSYNGNQPCYVVLRDSTGAQNAVNAAVPVNHFIPGIPGSQIGSNCLIPQVIHLNPKVEPKLPEFPSVIKASPVPVPLSNTKVLTGTPPCRAPKGYAKDRKGSRTHPCPYCSHFARDSHSLKTHILTHTKEKPFACEFCDYRATQRAHIQKHMNTHVNGNRRGKCLRNGEIKR